MIFAFEELKHRYSDFKINKILLDSAHDNMETYRYFLRKGITPFIDLNERMKGNTVYKDDILLTPNGIPICPKGLEMKNNGYDHLHSRRKFRCPLVKKGVVTCDTPCSASSYGRCVYTYTEDNPRWNPAISRTGEKWKQEYDRRTTVERSNKREKVDYCLEAAHHRSSKMWHCRIFAIMMCQHIDAWMPVIDFSLKEILGY